MAQVDGLVYHNTTVDFTGKPGAAKVTSLEADYNNFKIKSDVKDLFAQLASVGAGIDDVTQPSPTEIQIELTDGTVFGPFTLPTSPMNGRGQWTPSTPYAVNDLVYDGTALYVVPFAHTSATTFDPGANDGAGNNFYDVVFDFALSASALRQTTTKTEPTTSRTVSSADVGAFVLCTNAAGCDVTIPPDSSYDAPVDTECSYRQSAAGPVTIVAGAGVTFNDGVTALEAFTADLGAVITIKKTSANTWVGFGRFVEPTA